MRGRCTGLGPGGTGTIRTRMTYGWVIEPDSLAIIGRECCLEFRRVLLEDEGGGEEGVQDWGLEGIG